MLKRNALQDRLYRRKRRDGTLSPIWWVWGYDINGKKWRDTTEQTERKAALEVAKAIELRRAVPTDRAAEEAQAYTLADALKELAAEDVRQNAAPKTVEFHRNRGRHLARLFGADMRLVDLSREARERTNKYMDTRLAEGAHRHTIQKDFRVLIHAVRLARGQGKYSGDPAELMPPSLRKQKSYYTPGMDWLDTAYACQLLIDHTSEEVNHPRSAMREFVMTQPFVVSESEVVRRAALIGLEITVKQVNAARLSQRRLEARGPRERARTHRNGTAYINRKDHVAAYILSGTRKAELLAICPEHVFLDERRVWVEGTKTDEAPRWVWLTETTVEIFARKLAGKRRGEPIFEPWPSADRDLKAAWRRALKHAVADAARRGVELIGNWPESLSFNDLRRTFCSLMATAGVPMQHCAKLMGHKSLDMVMQVYGRLAPESLESAVAALPTLALPSAPTPTPPATAAGAKKRRTG